MSTQVNIQISREDLLRAIRHDCVTFLAFYLEDELTLEVPDFHIEIWEELLSYLDKINSPEFMIGVLYKLFCVPREHAKSTLSKLAVILFMRYSPLSFTLYASNTRGVSMAAVKDIVSWLTSTQDSKLYGPTIQEKGSQAEGLWILTIQTPNFGAKRIILKAIGADAQVRGTLIDNKRPELIIIDDCEDLSTASSAQTQKRLDSWLLGSLLKSAARRALVIMLGNMISDKTILARLAKEKSWNPTVFGSIVRDKETMKLKPLWPGRHTLESLIEEYKFYRRNGNGHVWAHEMMNLTAESVFGTDFSKAVQIPMPSPDQIIGGCLVLDPAFGLKGFNDESAITVHALLRSEYEVGKGIPHIIDSWHGRVGEEQLLDELIRLSIYWGLNTWVIEATAAQRLLIPYFTTALKIRQMNPEAFLMLPITGGKDAKSSRIKAFKDSVGSGNYGVVEEQTELFNQLLEYNPMLPPEHDDLPDSASFGSILWVLYGNLVESNGRSQVAMLAYQQGNESGGLSEFEMSPH